MRYLSHRVPWLPTVVRSVALAAAALPPQLPRVCPPATACGDRPLGIFDVIAIGPSDVRCIQVKANEYLSAVEREQLKALSVPAKVTWEYWRFVDGQPGKPRIEIL